MMTRMPSFVPGVGHIEFDVNPDRRALWRKHRLTLHDTAPPCLSDSDFSRCRTTIVVSAHQLHCRVSYRL